MVIYVKSFEFLTNENCLSDLTMNHTENNTTTYNLIIIPYRQSEARNSTFPQYPQNIKYLLAYI